MNPELQQKKYVDQIKINYLFDYAAKEVGVSFIASSFLFIFLIPQVEIKLLASWYIGMMTLGLLRILLTSKYRKSKNKNQTKNFADFYTFLILLTGFGWAMVLVLVPFPTPADYVVLVRLFLVGQVVMAAYQFHFYPQGSLAFSSPLMVGYTIEFLLSPTPLGIAMGVGNLLFVGFIILFSKNATSYSQEKMELRAEVEQKKDLAEKANQAKSQFLASASHDIRQPLQSISLMTSVLEQKPLDTEDKSIVADIRKSVDVLEDYLSTLLDLSKIESGSLFIAKRRFALNDILTQVRNEFSLEAETKQLFYYVEPCDIELDNDPTQLARILRNLISNAIRYTPSGLVKVLCKKKIDSVEIRVLDSGVGIPKERQKSIFEDYVQIGNDSRTAGNGAGLGLSIVKRLVDILGIRLEVISEPNKGSCFTLSIPITGTKIIEPRSGSWLSRSTPIQPSTQLDLNVLVIDDDTGITKAATKALQAWGCSVMAFDSVNKLKIALNDKIPAIDVVVADYRIDSTYNGVDVIQLIETALKRPVASVIISGDTESAELRELIKVMNVLYKPIKPAQLRACLNNIARQIQSEKKLNTNKIETF